MKKLLILFLLFSANTYGQIQISDFQYPLDSQTLAYKYYPRPENAVLISSQSGVSYLDLGTKETTPLKFYDSVSVASVTSIKENLGIFTDSVGSEYVCSIEKEELKILHTIYQPNLTSRGLNFSQAGNSLFFFDDKVLYKVSGSTVTAVDTSNADSYYFNLLISDDKNWAFLENQTVHFNGYSNNIQDLISPNFATQLFFVNSRLLIYPRKGAIYEGIIEGENLNLKLLSDGFQPSALSVLNDTLFAWAEFAKYTYSFEDSSFNLLEEDSRLNIIKYKDESLSLYILRNYQDNAQGIIYNSDSTKSIYISLVNQTKGGGHWSQKNQILDINKFQDRYLFKLSLFEKEIFLLTNTELEYQVFFEPIKPLPNDHLLCHSNLGYDNNSNTLYELDTNALSFHPFVSLPKTKSFLAQPDWLYGMTIGENNLAVGSQYEKVLVSKAGENKIIDINPSINYQNRAFFLNDRIINVSRNIYYGQNNLKFENPTNSLLFLGLEDSTKNFKFFNLETETPFIVKWESVSLEEGDYVSEIYALDLESILFKTQNKIYHWNGIKGQMIHLEDRRFYAGTGLIDDPQRKSVYLVRNINKPTGVQIFHLSKKNNFTEVYSDTKNTILTYTPDLKDKGILLLNLDKLLFLVKDKAHEIEKFWDGSILSYGFDLDNQLYVSTQNTKGNNLYSSINPNAPIARTLSYPFFIRNNSYHINYQKDMIYIDNYLNKTTLFKYDFTTKSLSYADLEVTNGLYNQEPVSPLIVEAYNKKRELNFYLFDNDGSHILNKKTINSTSFRYSEGKVFVLGNLKGETRQVFKLPLAEKELVNIEWTVIEESQLPLAIPKEVKTAHVYPNPFEKELKLDITSLEYIDKSIFVNTTGSVVKSTSFNPQSESIQENHQKTERWVANSSSQIPSGVYYLILFSDNQKIVKKVIKH